MKVNIMEQERFKQTKMNFIDIDVVVKVAG